MRTAFHIGGGKATQSSSDSPVVLTPEGHPFIPGSSFKGALRSTVEKIVPGLPPEGEWYSCALIDINNEDVEAIEARYKRVCSTGRQKYYADRRRNAPTRAERDLIPQQALKDLCDTCQLFGSPYSAAHLVVNDLYMPVDAVNDIVQMRDGVAIDRDSETAKDRLKYDYEVVPASATFEVEIALDNATTKDLQLISIGLSEYVSGFGTIGGKRSRGLGACLLDDLVVYKLDLTGDEKQRNRLLRNYLLGHTPDEKFPPKIAGGAFLEEQINKIFSDSL